MSRIEKIWSGKEGGDKYLILEIALVVMEMK